MDESVQKNLAQQESDLAAQEHPDLAAQRAHALTMLLDYESQRMREIARADHHDRVSRALRHAADYLEERGWCQKHFHSDQGHCVLGALYKVASVHVGDAAAYRMRDWGIANVAAWNDAPGRTKEEVVAMLRRVADAVG